MKYYLFLITMAVILFALIFGGCRTLDPSQTTSPPSSTSHTSQKTSTLGTSKLINLRYADTSPPTAWSSTHALQPWLKQIEEATNGRIKFEVYYDQTLCKAADAWQAVITGVADVAFITHSIYPGLTPLTDVMTLPFLPVISSKQSSGIAWRLYERFPSIKNEFKAVHLLEIHTTAPSNVYNNKREIKTLNDWQGLKIRVGQGPPAALMKRLGATPISLATGDIYMGLSKGLIDGSTLNWDGIISYRFYEVVKYRTVVPLSILVQSIVMNNERWNSIPGEMQDAINSKCGFATSEFWGYNMFDSVEPSAIAQIKRNGYSFIEYIPPQEEIQKWIDIGGKPIRASWVADRTSEGLPEAQEILSTVLELANSYEP
jgi:TRAP-type transport system periplasmic protein